MWLVLGWLRVQIAWTSASPDTHMFPVCADAFFSLSDVTGVWRMANQDLIHQLVAEIQMVSARASLCRFPNEPVAVP